VKKLAAKQDRMGEHLVALAGGALALSLLLVIGLLALLAVNGLSTFWPRAVAELELVDGRRMMGEIHVRETATVQREKTGPSETFERLQLKGGNRDLTGADFIWLDDREVRSISHPKDAVLLERREWGNFYGRMVEIRSGEQVVAGGSDAAWRAFHELQPVKEREFAAIRELERGPIGTINREIQKLERRRKGLAPQELSEAERRAREQAIDAELAAQRGQFEKHAVELDALREAWGRERLVVEAADGTRKELPVGVVVRAIRPNELRPGEKLALYGARLWEFVSGEPRESNTEGGIFPAIFGTVMMVFIMTFFVSPFGVLAAVYLREYAKQGPLVRAVRIAVNNLAGVPSIVFGMFGLGFFVYLVGGSIDRLFYPEALPAPTFGTGGILWASLTLALLTVPVVIVAAEEGLAAVPRAAREGSLALGATRFETTWRVVVPAAAPGILTGLILAMARAAGEVAPLMIVGMVKLAPELPLDGVAPFVHLERKFMHLGFHIYDVGFQSPNVEATKPLVFATALLLVAVVMIMNLAAIAIRNRLRRKYATSAV
jgi:phosphate transport system permease protein